MLSLQIDQENCIQCGECAEDCPYNILTLDGGYPEVVTDREDQCIQCQHCFTVCPTGALSIFGLHPEQSTPLKGNLPSAAQLTTLFQGRRSVRQYLDEPIEEHHITEMLEVVSNGPTGVNNRQLLFTVIENQKIMQEIRSSIYSGIERLEAEGNLPAGLEFFGNFVEAYAAGNDVLFRGAPHLLILSSPATGPSPVPDCLIAMTYFELLAAAKGYGTVWNGLCNIAFTKLLPDLLARLKIPADHTIGYMMSFGKPAVAYHRTVQRGNPQINSI